MIGPSHPLMSPGPDRRDGLTGVRYKFWGEDRLRSHMIYVHEGLNKRPRDEKSKALNKKLLQILKKLLGLDKDILRNLFLNKFLAERY